MIRVLQVFNAPDRGGSETMIMNLYRNIDRSQIQFDFTNHTCRKGAFEDEIIKLGGHVNYLPKFKGYNYWNYIKAWKRLLAANPEYQIIHIHNYNIAGIVTKIASRMGVKTRITHSHSTRLNLSLIKRIAFKIFYRDMIRNSTHLFACGTKAGLFLFKSRKFTVIPNALEPKRFRYNVRVRQLLRNTLEIEENVKIYGHVGSFRTPKNHDFLIDIFSEIKKREPSSKLVLIGCGELQESIKNKVQNLGLNDSVFFMGQQSNVNEWLSAFDVFLLPSLWEGLPVSVIEAQCAGLPCAISDIIDNNVNLTGIVKFISLKKMSTEWANEILNIKQTDRFRMCEIITNSSYNIDKLAKSLSDFYLNV